MHHVLLKHTMLSMQIARDLGLAGEGESRGGGKGKGGRKGEAAGAAAAAAFKPLSREEAVAAAKKRFEAFKLPHKLPCGVTITSLGQLHPEDPSERGRLLGCFCWRLPAAPVAAATADAAAVIGPACRCCCLCCTQPVLPVPSAPFLPLTPASCLCLPPQATAAPRACGPPALRRSGRTRRACASSTPSRRRPRGPPSGAPAAARCLG